MTWEEVFERAKRDHARWRGKKILTPQCHVGDGCDLEDMDFPGGLTVIVNDKEFCDHDWSEHHDDGGLIDTYYNVSGDVPTMPGFHACWTWGPTYYLNGRVDYPEWWDQSV